MPDAWEFEHGFVPNLNDAAVDTDGDGQSNLQEYLAGTDPRSASSRLTARVDWIANGVRLSFTAAAGRAYSIHQGDSPMPQNWSLVTTTAPQMADHVEQVDIPAAAQPGQKFFRLATPPR
jgi:hypothetical protein